MYAKFGINISSAKAILTRCGYNYTDNALMEIISYYEHLEKTAGKSTEFNPDEIHCRWTEFNDNEQINLENYFNSKEIYIKNLDNGNILIRHI